jgi:hypothetical protein
MAGQPPFACKMNRSFIFDYLLLVLAPLITFLFSKVQVFAPLSKYVVLYDAIPAPAELLISTKYLEIYANHNLTVALVLGISILSILHLSYFIYAVWRPPMPIHLPWITEHETSRNPKEDKSRARSRITRSRIVNLLQNQLPGPTVHRHSIVRSAIFEFDKSTTEDIELKELTMPQSALTRGTRPLTLGRSAHEPQHRAEEDDADWKTVYCEEWVDSSDGDGATRVESWGPT